MAVTQNDVLIGEVVAGRYEVLERIGAGGMGAVYRALQRDVGRMVALKVLRNEHAKNDRIIKRFLREIRATARIESPNTVRLYDYGVAEDGTVHLAMELLRGRTLAQVLRASGPLAIPQLVSWGAQIARGLAAAHAGGILHRDLKPANIMITDPGDGSELIKVLDFGIASFVDPADDAERERLTQSGMVMGTPEFMAPEQVTPGPLDERCDVYALGVVLYLMATGRTPFSGGTAVSVMFAHVNEAPKPPSDHRAELPRWLDDVILTCLEKSPSRRYRNANELALALEREGRGASGPPTGAQRGPNAATGAQAGVSSRQMMLGMLVIGVLSGALVGALAVLAWVALG